jgi:hypothetical protein
MSSNSSSTKMFDFDAVRFKIPGEQKNPYSNKIYINDASKPRNQQALKITLPRLYTFGVKPFRDNPLKFSINVQFPMKAHGVPTKETESALQELLAFENKIIDYMTHMSVNYFGTSHSKEKIKSMFTPFVKFPKKKDNDSEIDYDTPPYVQCQVQYYSADKTFQNLDITDENDKKVFTSPSKNSPIPLVNEGQFVDCEVWFQNIWFTKTKFGLQFFATRIKVHSTQGLVQEIVEKKKVEEEVVIEVVEEKEEEVVEEEEEFQLFEIEGKSYYIENENHGSFIYTYTEKETEVEIGEEVGVFCNGVARFFQQFISVTTGNRKVVQIERRS